MSGRLAERGTFVSLVRLFEADPELLDGLPADVAGRLRKAVTVEMVEIARGMSLLTLSSRASGQMLILLEGMLCYSQEVERRRGLDLLGPGEIVRPGTWEGGARSSIVALTPVRLGVLDDDFIQLIQRFPVVGTNLMDRMASRSRALCDRLAIARIPHLDERVLALLWHLSERWGSTDEDGVLIRLRLSHDLLADLACAQRPSITGAIGRLRERGLLDRGPSGLWRLTACAVALHATPRSRTALAVA